MELNVACICIHLELQVVPSQGLGEQCLSGSSWDVSGTEVPVPQQGLRSLHPPCWVSRGAGAAVGNVFAQLAWPFLPWEQNGLLISVAHSPPPIQQ